MFPSQSIVVALGFFWWDGECGVHFFYNLCFHLSCFRAQRRLLCYLFLYFFLLLGSETASLLPFPLLFLAFGLRDGSSVTFSFAFSCFWAQRRLLCYLFLCFSLLLGSETASLLPSPLLFLAFGLRDGFSVTFSSAFPCFWAQRRLLCYLLLYFFLLSGTETASLLPFPLLFLAFGLRDGFSVTFSSTFSCFWAQRRLLCYLFLCFFLLLGSETASLLPSPLFFLAFGLRDGFSVTFSSTFSCFRAQRPLLCYLFLCFFLLSGTETASLLPFPLLFLAFGHRDGFSVTFPSTFSCFWAQRRLLLKPVHQNKIPS